MSTFSHSQGHIFISSRWFIPVKFTLWAPQKKKKNFKVVIEDLFFFDWFYASAWTVCGPSVSARRRPRTKRADITRWVNHESHPRPLHPPLWSPCEPEQGGPPLHQSIICSGDATWSRVSILRFSEPGAVSSPPPAIRAPDGAVGSAEKEPAPPAGTGLMEGFLHVGSGLQPGGCWAGRDLDGRQSGVKFLWDGLVY